MSKISQTIKCDLGKELPNVVKGYIETIGEARLACESYRSTGKVQQEIDLGVDGRFEAKLLHSKTNGNWRILVVEEKEERIVYDLELSREQPVIIFKNDKECTVSLFSKQPLVFHLIEFDLPGESKVEYRIWDEEENKFIEFKNKFNLQLLGYTLVDKSKNLVYEPGVSVEILEVQVRNPSDMDIPKGMHFSLLDLDVELPEIKSKETMDIAVNKEFLLPAKKEWLPQEIPYQDSLQLDPYIHLNHKKCILNPDVSFGLPLFDPVKVNSVTKIGSMLQNMVYEMVVSVENRAITAIWDANIQFVSTDDCIDATIDGKDMSDGYLINFNGDKVKDIKFSLKLNDKAMDYLSGEIELKTLLVFRGRVIQMFKESIRIVPTFSENPYDALIITCSQLSHKTLKNLCNILCKLNMKTINYLDAEHCSGLEGLDKQKLDLSRKKVILYPHSKWIQEHGFGFKKDHFGTLFSKRTCYNICDWDKLSHPMETGVLILDSDYDSLNEILYDLSQECGVVTKDQLNSVKDSNVFKEGIKNLCEKYMTDDSYLYQAVLQREYSSMAYEELRLYKSNCQIENRVQVLKPFNYDLLETKDDNIQSKDMISLYYGILNITSFEHKLELFGYSGILSTTFDDAYRHRLTKHILKANEDEKISINIGDIIHYSLAQDIRSDKSCMYKLVYFLSTHLALLENDVFFTRVGSLLLAPQVRKFNLKVFKNLIEVVKTQFLLSSTLPKELCMDYMKCHPEFEDLIGSVEKPCPPSGLRAPLDIKINKHVRKSSE